MMFLLIILSKIQPEMNSKFSQLEMTSFNWLSPQQKSQKTINTAADGCFWNNSSIIFSAN